MHDLRPLDSSVGPFPPAVEARRRRGPTPLCATDPSSMTRSGLPTTAMRACEQKFAGTRSFGHPIRRKQGDGSARRRRADRPRRHFAPAHCWGARGCADPLRSAG